MSLPELGPMLPAAATLTGDEVVTVIQNGLPVQTTTGDIGTSSGIDSITATAPITVTAGDTPVISTSIATDRLVGRDTAATGVFEALTVGGGIEFTGSGGIQTSAFTGDVTKAAGSTVTAIDGTLNTGATAGTNVAEARTGSILTAPNVATADLVSIVADVLLADGALILAGQPDYGRKLQIRITDGDASITAGIATIVGIDPSGTDRTEPISLVGGTATKTSTWAYAVVTSITVSALAGNDGADNIGVGVSAALGLPGCKTPASSGFAVFRAAVDGVSEAVGTVDATAGTIIPTTAPNGSRSYAFSYTYAVTPTQNTHTHTTVA